MQKKFTIKKNTVRSLTKNTGDKQSDVQSSSITKKSISNDIRISIISAANIDASNYKRLQSPIDAERKKRALSSSARTRRRAVRDLTFKSAPPIPTAPKDPRIIRRRRIWSSVKNHISLIDIPLTITVLLFCLFGLFAVYSATLSYGTSRFLLVQCVGLFIGISGALVLSVIDYRTVVSKYKYIILLNIFILVFTLLFGEGVTGETNKNWISIGPLNVQPSEFAKLLFIVTFAAHLSRVREKMKKFTTVLLLAIHAAVIFGLVLLQGDVGTLTIFLIIFVCMCFSAGLSIWYYILGGAAFLFASPFLWAKLDQYQKDRILLCFDDSIDPLGQGERYQQMWSENAISSGGLTGKGFTNGSITQNFTDPQSAKHTDMIYSTICEELGLIGALLVLAVTVFIIFRILKIAINCENNAGRYICVGVASMLMIQVMENVGMCLGIMPVIGITYPFLSYGGSSIMSCLFAVGLVLSVSTHKEQTFFTK